MSSLYYQLWPLPSVSSFARPLKGRTVLLTGGSVGLRYEAAKHLASLGPSRLIVTSRTSSSPSVQDAVRSIEAAGQDKVGKVECWELDQASFVSVKRFCERFEREGGGKLDLLVLNAGLVQLERSETEDGWETMLQVNHLATCLLALRLLPFLLATENKAPGPRLVVVSSGQHRIFEDVPEADEGSPGMLRVLSSKEYCEKQGRQFAFRRYPLTKLFNVLFVRALAERLPPGSPLGVHAVNPGFCRSQLARDVAKLPLMIRAIFQVRTMLLARTTEMGSRPLVHAAVGKDLDGKNGEYAESCLVSEPSEFVRSDRGKVVEEKLWSETMEVLVKVDSRVSEIAEKYLRKA